MFSKIAVKLIIIIMIIIIYLLILRVKLMKMLYITKMLRTWKRHLNFQVGATMDRMHILHDVVRWLLKQ